MQLLRVLVPLLGLVLPALASTEVPADLVIEKVFVPEGCTIKAQAGDPVSVHYTGRLFSNGDKFDSSLDRGSPFTLTLGVGQVIKGWDEGLVGMCVGEKRKLTIPPAKAYGSRGFGNIIPANSALVFDVELITLDPKIPREEL